MIRLVKSPQGDAQIVHLDYGQTQKVVCGGGATPVAATSDFLLSSSAVLLQATVDVHFKVSKNGTEATTEDPIAWAKADRFIGVNSNGCKVSAIKVNGEADGMLYITPLEEDR